MRKKLLSIVTASCLTFACLGVAQIHADEARFDDTNAQAALDRINAIRAEAHAENIKTIWGNNDAYYAQANVANGQPVSWGSAAIEYAKVRAKEQVERYGHDRPEGHETSTGAGGGSLENLAFSSNAQDMLWAVNRWYSEKPYYLQHLAHLADPSKPDTTQVWGHYNTMISNEWKTVGLASYYTPSTVGGAYHYVATAEFSRLSDAIAAYPSAAVEPPASGSEETTGPGETTPSTQPEGDAGTADNPKDSGTAATEGEGASSAGSVEGSGTTTAPAGEPDSTQAGDNSDTSGQAGTSDKEPAGGQQEGTAEGGSADTGTGSGNPVGTGQSGTEQSGAESGSQGGSAGASEGSSAGSQTSDSKGSSSEGSALSPAYTVVEGANQVVTLGSTSPVIFKSNGEFDEFASLKLDGVTVDPANYSAKRGSVIVELKKAFADKLSVGEHSLSFVFKNGVESSTKFTVKAASSNATATSDAAASTGASTGSAAKPQTNASQTIKPQADAQNAHNKEQDTAKTEEKSAVTEENTPAVAEETQSQTQEEASVAAAVAKKESSRGAVLPQTSDTSFVSLYFAGALACMGLCIALGLRRRAE